jgi:hypothetical protein
MEGDNYVNYNDNVLNGGDGYVHMRFPIPVGIFNY